MSRADEMIGSGSVGVATPETELRVVDDKDNDAPDGLGENFWCEGLGCTPVI